MKIKVTHIIFSFGLLFAFTALTPLTGIELFGSITIGVELILMIYLSWKFILFNNRLIKSDFLFVLAFIACSLLHFMCNINSDIFTYIKVYSILVFYFAGKYVSGDILIRKSFWGSFTFFSIFLIPLVIRVLQILFKFPNTGYYSIFVNSNNFIYYVIVSSVLLYCWFINDKKKYFSYLAFGSILSKTIGGFISVFIAILYYYKKRLLNLKILITSLFLLTVVFFLVTFSHLEVFERMNNSLSVFNDLLNDNFSLASLSNIEYGDAILYAKGGQEDLSFLFRIKNWTEIISTYKDLDTYHIFFGNGFMSIPKITSTGLVAHNDYLGIMYEFGVIPFILLVIGYFKTLLKIRKNILIISFLAIAIFHFTENLYYNFLITALHFFLLGYVMRNRNENPAN